MDNPGYYTGIEMEGYIILKWGVNFMNSLKTIKIVILTGLSLQVATPAQAGIKELAQRYVGKVSDFIKADFSRVLGVAFCGGIVGALVGDYAQQKQKTIEKREQGILQTMADQLEPSMDASDAERKQINDTQINTITTLPAISKSALKKEIKEYNNKSSNDKTGLSKLLTRLINSESMNASRTIQSEYFVYGIIGGFLSVLGLWSLNEKLNKKAC